MWRVRSPPEDSVKKFMFLLQRSTRKPYHTINGKYLCVQLTDRIYLLTAALRPKDRHMLCPPFPWPQFDFQPWVWISRYRVRISVSGSSAAPQSLCRGWSVDSRVLRSIPVRGVALKALPVMLRPLTKRITRTNLQDRCWSYLCSFELQKTHPSSQ